MGTAHTENTVAIYVYVVTLYDLHQDHLVGVYGTREGAQRYVDREEEFLDATERLLINKQLVRN
jgi:hypothetical protein